MKSENIPSIGTIVPFIPVDIGIPPRIEKISGELAYLRRRELAVI